MTNGDSRTSKIGAPADPMPAMGRCRTPWDYDADSVPLQKRRVAPCHADQAPWRWFWFMYDTLIFGVHPVGHHNPGASCTAVEMAEVAWHMLAALLSTRQPRVTGVGAAAMAAGPILVSFVLKHACATSPNWDRLCYSWW